MVHKQRDEGVSYAQMGRNYGTPVVGETSDWGLNDLFRSALTPAQIQPALQAAASASQPEIQEGPRGGGGGMSCHGFTGGTGTSSRIVYAEDGTELVVGAICQSNYGHTEDLSIGGVPVGRLLIKEGLASSRTKKSPGEEKAESRGRTDDGSIVIMIL
jgi:D-aminopeptidase